MLVEQKEADTFTNLNFFKALLKSLLVLLKCAHAQVWPNRDSDLICQTDKEKEEATHFPILITGIEWRAGELIFFPTDMQYINAQFWRVVWCAKVLYIQMVLYCTDVWEIIFENAL